MRYDYVRTDQPLDKRNEICVHKIMITHTAPEAVSLKFRQLLSGLDGFGEGGREFFVILGRILNCFLGGTAQVRIVIIAERVSEIAYCSGCRAKTVGADMVTLALPLSTVLDFDYYPAGGRPIDGHGCPAGAVVAFVIGLADNAPAKR